MSNVLDTTGDHTRQYHLFFHDGSAWHKRTVSARSSDDPSVKLGTPGASLADIGRMSRPIVLADADDRIIVVYSDNRADGITVVFSLPLAIDPGRIHWTRMMLTQGNLGQWDAHAYCNTPTRFNRDADTTPNEALITGPPASASATT